MSESGRVILPSYRLKQGDQVVMHTCGEAGDPDNCGKIWTCKTDQFTRGKGVYEQDSVFLEGYSGSFAPEFLQKGILPSEDESILNALKESQQEMARLKTDHAALLVKYHAEENRFQKRNEELAEAQQTITNYQTARPLSEWHEDFGDALWWELPVEEPPYVGSPLDSEWPGYHTHWTPFVIPGNKEGEKP